MYSSGRAKWKCYFLIDRLSTKVEYAPDITLGRIVMHFKIFQNKVCILKFQYKIYTDISLKK
jgi:hypothetical protein